MNDPPSLFTHKGVENASHAVVECPSFHEGEAIIMCEIEWRWLRSSWLLCLCDAVTLMCSKPLARLSNGGLGGEVIDLRVRAPVTILYHMCPNKRLMQLFEFLHVFEYLYVCWCWYARLLVELALQLAFCRRVRTFSSNPGAQ